MISRLLMRLGFKPHLFRCPGGHHDWRKTHGDERMMAGAVFVCRNCPRTTNHAMAA
jgi:hypothetical protein